MFRSIMTGTCAYRLWRVFQCIFNGWTFVFFTFNAAHYQTCRPAALARVAVGRRWPAEAYARGALSPCSVSCSRGAGRQRRGTAGRDALLEEEGIPGRPHPTASLSTPPPPLAAGPAPPFPSGVAARGGGCGYLRAPAHRNSRPTALPASSAFRRRISVRGSRAAGRPGRVTPASPTWRRGPGGLLRGRQEKAAQACGALPSSAPTPATGTTELGPALCSAEGRGALFWGLRFLGESLTFRFSALCLRSLCH